jgi:hypothetical protein
MRCSNTLEPLDPENDALPIKVLIATEEEEEGRWMSRNRRMTT